MFNKAFCTACCVIQINYATLMVATAIIYWSEVADWRIMGQFLGWSNGLVKWVAMYRVAQKVRTWV